MVKTFEMASAVSSHYNSSDNSVDTFLHESENDSLTSDFSIVTSPMEPSLGIGNGTFNHFNESHMNLSQYQGELSNEELQITVQQLWTENTQLKETVQKGHDAMKSQIEIMVNAKEQIESIVKDQMEKRDQAKHVIEQLRQENNDLKEALVQSEGAKIAAYECQIKELKDAVENQQILYHQLKADNDELLADCNQLKQSYDNAMIEKSAILADYVELKNKLEALERSKELAGEVASFQFVESKDIDNGFRDSREAEDQVKGNDDPEEKVADIPDNAEESVVEFNEAKLDDDDYNEHEKLSLQSAEKSIKNLLTQLGLEQQKQNELQFELENEKAKNEDLVKRVNEQDDVIKQLSEQQTKIQNGEKHTESNLHDSERKFAMANCYIQKYRERCDSLETWLNVYQGKLDTIGNEDSEVVMQLRGEVQNLRKTLEDEKQRSEDDKKQLLEEREKNATLMAEHLQLKDTWETMFHEDQNQGSQTEAYYGLQLRAYQEREDSFHARLVLLEEKLKNKEDELEAAHTEILKLKTDLENWPVLQAQMEVYRTDFQEERRAREALNDEKDTLLQEISRLKGEQQAGRTPTTSRRPPPMNEDWTFEQPNAPDTENPGNVEVVENPNGQTYVCPKCGFVFDSFQPLLNHVNSCLDNDE